MGNEFEKKIPVPGRIQQSASKPAEVTPKSTKSKPKAKKPAKSQTAHNKAKAGVETVTKATRPGTASTKASGNALGRKIDPSVVGQLLRAASNPSIRRTEEPVPVFHDKEFEECEYNMSFLSSSDGQ